MNLYTENLSELADITAATLEERTTGEGVLRLEFAGFGPEWLNYMEPVTLWHKGEVLFHGKLVRVGRTNDGGTVTAMGIGELPELVLDTSAGTVLSISDIEPQYEACCTGVVIAWTNDAGQTELHMFPETLDMAADGVKVFSLSGTYYVESWDKVAQEYYEAASVLQYGGSVRVLAAGLEVSPLGRRLNLVGPGTHQSWATMGAVVTACTWDFMEGVAHVSLGRDFADPDFADAAAVEDGGDYVEEYERNMSGDADGHWPFLTNEGSEGSGGGGGGSWGAQSQEPKYVVEDVTGQYGATATPGADGWVQSLYVYGVWSGQMAYEESIRQLMRFKEDGDKVYLQLVTQKSGDYGSTWMPA